MKREYYEIWGRINYKGDFSFEGYGIPQEFERPTETAQRAAAAKLYRKYALHVWNWVPSGGGIYEATIGTWHDGGMNVEGKAYLSRR